MNLLLDKNKDDAIALRISEVGDLKLSRNFSLSEFASKDGADEVRIHPALLVGLQAIREKFGRITINSGYRSPSHNKKIGGAVQSMHLFGMAADIRSDTATPTELANYARGIGFGGVKAYPTFCHVDVGPKRSW